MIYNLNGALGGTHILNGNLQPLFNHQTVFEISNGGQIKNVKNSITGINDIVPIAKRGCIGGLDTEPGYIQVINYYHDPVLPLCMNTAEVSDWEFDVEIVGGYQPEPGYIKVYQVKDDDPCECSCTPTGRIQFTWTEDANNDPLCCMPKLWHAGFSIANDFCLDSNQYPELRDATGAVIPPESFTWDHGSNTGKIPGKDVDLCIKTIWSGCPLAEQEFSIISVRDLNHQFP